jgi:hypothetical protein
VTDSRAIDPRDGTPMCFTDDLAFARIFKTQSRNYCFAMKSLIGKDSKKAYEEFRDFFLFFENVKKFGVSVWPQNFSHHCEKSTGYVKPMEVLKHWVRCTEERRQAFLPCVRLQWKYHSAVLSG